MTASGALAEVEAALRRAYEATATSEKGRLKPSSVVEHELKKTGWKKAYTWAGEELERMTADSFDGWKVFEDAHGARFGVAAEVEWNWERIYFDLMKFWRAERGGQIRAGIEILRGPDSFKYAVEHQWRLYGELFASVPVVFCALNAADLAEPEFVPRFTSRRVYDMP